MAEDEIKRRMPASKRREAIIEGAESFFAEHGFGGSTRELCKGLGISNALLFKHFATKEDLLEEVYRRHFLRRWKTSWLTDLGDRSQPLADRLRHFYLEYSEVVSDPNWMRLNLLSGMADISLTRRYISESVGPIFCAIANERNAILGPGDAPAYEDASELSDEDLESVWHLHSTIIYYYVRKHIYGVRVSHDVTTAIDIAVAEFCAGLPTGSAPVPGAITGG